MKTSSFPPKLLTTRGDEVSYGGGLQSLIRRTDTNVVPIVGPGIFVDFAYGGFCANGTRGLLAQRSRPIPPTTPTSSPAMAGNAWCAIATCASARSFAIGPLRVSVLRVCDRLGAGDDRIRFTSAMLPPIGFHHRTAERRPGPRSMPVGSSAICRASATTAPMCARLAHRHDTRQHAVVARTKRSLRATRPLWLPSQALEVSAHDQPGQ